MKSRIAFRFSCEDLEPKWVYMWTFTFREVVAIQEARAKWSLALRQLVKRAAYAGLRVFELHPGGHGLHVHCVTVKRYDVNVIRRIAAAYGFGRIHVKAIPKEKAGYVGKYLGKQSRKRPECFKGVRLWASVGKFPHHKVSDIVCDTPFTRAYKALGALIPRFSSFSWQIRQRLAMSFDMGSLREFLTFCPSGIFSEAPWYANIDWDAPLSGWQRYLASNEVRA